MSEYRLFARSAIRTAITNALGRWSPRYGAPRRILVVKLDHLGDILMATPALRALRGAHPGVPIDAVVLPGSRVLLEGSPLVDRVLRYDSPRFRRGEPKRDLAGASSDDRAGLLQALAPHRYDWVVELRGDEWTAGALLGALRPARRFDRGTVRMRDWLSRRLGRLRGRCSTPPLHEVETNLAIVRDAISRSPDISRVEAPPWPHAAIELDHLAAELAPTLDLTQPYAVVQLGATWAPRAWRARRFGAVAAALRAAYDAQVVVLGMAEDSPLRDEFLAGGGPSDTSFFFGALPIPAVGALLRRARLYVGSDGGMAHLAAACGTPSVVLFGPQNPARFRPWGPRITILHRAVDCYPCAQVVCVRPAEPCVNLHSVEETVKAAMALWNSESPDPGLKNPRP